MVKDVEFAFFAQMSYLKWNELYKHEDYKNPETINENKNGKFMEFYDYKEFDESVVKEKLQENFSQTVVDDIQNGETKFFMYTDANYWGFYTVGVKREEKQLFMGELKYFSFEEDITTISFFDGRH